MARDDAALVSRIRFLRRCCQPDWIRLVREALAASGGRVPDAAAQLGVSERTLYRWLSEAHPFNGRPWFEKVERVPVGVRRTAARSTRRAP